MSALRDIKSAITDGDIASDVAFQNDVNALLAAIAGLSSPPPSMPDLRVAVSPGALPVAEAPRRARSGRAR